MPRGDRTGPLGLGSRTGRGFGYCAGYAAPGFFTPGFGGGRGRGRGGFGYRHWYYATGLTHSQKTFWANPNFTASPLTKEESVHQLKTQKDILQQNLDELNKRLEELETS